MKIKSGAQQAQTPPRPTASPVMLARLVGENLPLVELSVLICVAENQDPVGPGQRVDPIRRGEALGNPKSTAIVQGHRDRLGNRPAHWQTA